MQDDSDSLLLETYVNDDYEKLVRAWINEKCAPELLQYQELLVLNLLEMCEMQSLNVENVQKGSIQENILELEIERILYFIRSYLKIRLAKVTPFTNSLFISYIIDSRLCFVLFK